MDVADERDEEKRAFQPTCPGRAPSRPRAATRLHTGAGRCVESSCDLRRGLVVEEGLPADLDVEVWIAAWLRMGC